MKILRSIEALAEIDAPVVLAAGVFDGLHLGHHAGVLGLLVCLLGQASSRGAAPRRDGEYLA
jgi:FAD synthase